MMDDAFLQALLAAPEDDAQRLIYADWLEERGDVRGWFLRAAVTLKGLSPDDGRADACRTQLKELRPQVPGEWLAAACRWLAEDEVREAVFRSMWPEKPPRDSIRFLAVEDAHDPSWYLWYRLLDQQLGLYPASAMECSPAGARLRTTGERGVSFRVDSLKWTGPNQCEVEGGYFFDGLAADGNLYRAELREGGWIVADVRCLWIS
jgi:uncharacterized protein (TIGR02996 family)